MLYPAELRAHALESTIYGKPVNTASRFCQPNRLRNRRWSPIRTLQTFDRGGMLRQLRRSVDHRRLGIRLSVRILDVRDIQSRPHKPRREGMANLIHGEREASGAPGCSFQRLVRTRA